ncbi:MAG: fibronectin type III domain-containing protein, partial [Saprospiraceae bacterium]|nr:fibronectin type III domain-containing protein [Saprospiraceae bacterium]
MQKMVYLYLLCCLGATSLPGQSPSASSAALEHWFSVETGRKPEQLSPPRLSPPEILETPGGIYFRWEKAAAPEAASVEYELVLSSATGERVYSAFTTTPFLLFSEANRLLQPYEAYQVQVNLRVTGADNSYLVSGEKTAIQFSYVPVCTPPSQVLAQALTETSLKLTLEGVAAVPGLFFYQIRYRPRDLLANWETQELLSGNETTLDNLKPNTDYIFEVQKICIWKDGTQVPSATVFQEASTVLDIPEGGCGGNYNFPPCNPPYSKAGGWTTLRVGGFTIEVLTLQAVVIFINGEQRDTVWSGTGRLSLPFGGKKVKVSWTQVNITAQGMICGTVTGIADAPQYWPDLNPAPAVWGDDICVPAPSAPGFDTNGIHSLTGMPWDPHGFGPTGTYDKVPPYPGYEPGMPFDSTLDPNGFNSQGIHFETNSIYGPNGCSQNHLDSLGQPCNPDSIPYYWLQDSTVTSEEAYELLQDVGDSLALWIQGKLNLWQSTFQDSIDQIETECDNIRGVMDGLMVSLGYQANRELVFGPGDIYFNPGMWKQFSAPPQQLNINLPRDPNQTLLEEKHVALYHCDKKLDTYDDFKAIVDSILLAQTGVSDLVTLFNDKILELSPEQAEIFLNDHNAFRAWLYAELRDYLSETFCGGQCSAPVLEKRQPRKPRVFPTSRTYEAWGAAPSAPPKAAPQAGGYASGSLMANGDPLNPQILKDAGEVTVDDINFEFLQGWEYVNGVHRAFYLEAIGDARRMAAYAPLITTHDPQLMPIEVDSRGSDGRKYSIWLDQMVFTPSSAELDAYIVLELPNGGKKIAFSALNLPFSPAGLITNPAKLQLASDVVVRMNNAVQLTLNAGPDTYVSFDCDGFAGIGLSIDVEVCRNVVKPLDPATMLVLPDPARVAAHIDLFVPTFDEIYAQIDIDPFVITDLEDYKWIIDGVVIDFSDAKSPTDPAPPGYVSPFVVGTTFSPLWRGFYMKQLSVEMPRQFDNNGSTMTIGVQQLVLDHMGVSGRVFATPLLPLENGNAGGWAFSVDEFNLLVLANQPVNAGFKGRIHVPIFSKGDAP